MDLPRTQVLSQAHMTPGSKPSDHCCDRLQVTLSEDPSWLTHIWDDFKVWHRNDQSKYLYNVTDF